MDDSYKSGFKPPSEFQGDARAPLIEPNTIDATELWLIQWPKDQVPEFDGQHLSLDLHHNVGLLGTFEGSSGKSYDVVSLAAQEPKARVFVSSAAESKIVGKIRRQVSFVRYLEASDVPKDDTKKLKQLYERSSATSLTNSKSMMRPREMVSHSSCVSEEKDSMSQDKKAKKKRKKQQMC